ncbi:MAG: histidine kinase [Armatimonadota bacterium]|nr:histidine kinase [Armatimonadota bacterium]MDR5690145.1 histidine kinase [Armatimonadota bacterium]MDR7394293.1 histidine kinase [Armatimonadota bacterium]MDR7406764.1 histidine kinase [Armatimonadota bacterium]MDR7409603.1 histidine kinase [Armatimonadota bacterium]
MLRIAAASAGLLTVLETIVLYSLLRTDPVSLAASLAVFNAVLAVVVGRLSVAQVGYARGHRGLPRLPAPLPVLRDGLNRDTAQQTADLLARLEGVRAVAVADRQEVLAVSGPDVGDSTLVGQMGQVVVGARTQARAQRRSVPGGVVVGYPLAHRREVLGALALVLAPDCPAVEDVCRSAELFARFLAMQLELAHMDQQARLAAEAELRALRAQINPHFFFNTLNTVVSYLRDDPETARRLLLRLADLFRMNMELQGQIIPFADEYQYIRDYLFIEQARFRDRLRVVYDIDPQVLKVGVPALSVQPIVENAVRHGIGPKNGPGTVEIRARLDLLTLRVHVVVRDDGVGMPPERVAEVLAARSGNGDRRSGRRGVGLANVAERLRRLYGDAYSLQIDSTPGKGTTVHLRLPLR